MPGYRGRAGIVGGGIGGLAAAIALREAGWEVTVYEQATAFTEIGAGIALASNSLTALDLIGVGKRVREDAPRDRRGGIRNQRGGYLAKGRLSDLAGGGDLVVMHRADLIAVLADAIPSRWLHAGSQVIRVGRSGEIETENGTAQYDLVVAADGINSMTRQRLWPDARAVRATGITAWRWIIDAAPPEFTGAVWGHRAEFGILPLAGGRTYAFASARAGIEGLGHFTGWPSPVPEMVAKADQVIEDELLELPVPRTLTCGSVALIGDAAHGMLPTLGQGAGMALEDAVTLAAHAPDLAAYNRARRRRVRAMSWLSHHGITLTEPKSKALTTARDRSAALIPGPVAAWATRRSLKLILGWRPPKPVSGAD